MSGQDIEYYASVAAEYWDWLKLPLLAVACGFALGFTLGVASGFFR
jgi:hypothetical protein